MDVLEISLDTEGLREDIDREVSKVAARTRNEGVSMYDILKIYTSDEPLVVNALQDSIRRIVSQFSDIATAGESVISFSVPDFDENHREALTDEIHRYLAERTVADWFHTRLPDTAQYFAAMSVECLARISTLLRHRKRVKR